MKKIILMIFVIVASAPFVFAQNIAMAKQKPTHKFMRQKLTCAQNILEGLALEKYDLIAQNGRQLGNMSLTNSFLTLKNPDYLREVSDFQGSVDGLVKAAQNKDLEAASKAYQRVIESCVHCHRQFRLDQLPTPH